ncbi:MAG: alpha/beta hydrolase domain-containing protein [Geminicoccaceae bacterium]
MRHVKGKTCALFVLYLVCMIGYPAFSEAAVERVELVAREPFAGGHVFGDAGAYERLKGKLHYAVDPADPANRSIVDIDLAPVDHRGLVTFSGDFILLRPMDADRGNGTLLYEVNNRGSLGLLPMFNLASRSNNPRGLDHAGDGLLFEQGYTMLWSAWNWDVVAGGERLLIDLPVASEHGKPITGMIAAEFVPTQPTLSAPFMWGHSKGYPPVDPDDPKAELSWRDEPAGERNVMPRTSWRFSDFDTSRSPPQPTRITLSDPLLPGRIYEVAYEAGDPRVVGLGLAAIRDAISHFRFEDATTGPAISSSLIFGISQSGRVINHMIWQGLHVDEAGRNLIDGALVHVAGAGKGSFNHRFAQTTRHPSHLEDHQYPADVFPFTTTPITDPVTGERDSMLDRARELGVLPKIVYTTTSTEYWTRAASLLHTDVLGQQDVPMAPDTRLYFFAGAQHGNWRWDVRGPYEHCTNALDHRFGMRVLLIALQHWIDGENDPPESVYPTIRAGTLGSVAQYRERFPDIPSARLPIGNLQPPRLDLGPRFASEGIVDLKADRLGQPYMTTVPMPDVDGIDQGGVRLPEIAVPVATYTGWNLRRVETGASEKLARWSGSMLPFTDDEAARLSTDDPRPSLSIRYRSRNDYAEEISAAANRLVGQRFLLEGDVDQILGTALERYDRVRSHRSGDRSCLFTQLSADEDHVR